MRKAIIIILAMVVALSALPITFACYTGDWWDWDRFWTPQEIVYCCPTYCNVIFDYGSIYAYDNEFTSSWEHKEVAQTTAEITNYGKNLDITITNAYPGYQGIVEFCVKNTGIYQATVTGITPDYPDPVYLQIDLTGELEGAVIQPGETKCGQLVIDGIPQLEDAQNRTGVHAFKFTITIDFLCFSTDCETAFAHGGSYAACFSEYGFGNWGWTNGPLGTGDYTFPLYAGAGSCDPADGELVGELTVNYDGSTAYVTYNMFLDYKMDETHLYVGNDDLPSKNGSYTVSPGQYPYKHDLNNASTDTYTVTGLSGTIYIVAHAVVCD